MKLEIKLEYSNPIELADLSISLQGMARAYKRYASTHDALVDDTAKLYVRELRSGSIEIELINEIVANAGVLAPIAVATIADLTAKGKVLFGFAKFVGDAYDFFRGKGKKPAELTGPSIRDLSNVLEPVANDPKGNIYINASEGASVSVQVTINSVDANAIQNRAEKEMEASAVPVQTIHKKVLLYWHKATAENVSSPSDRAIIDAITSKPLRVVFADDDVATKGAMIAGKINPFTSGFLVDVELHTIKGEPYAYKVTHLYETLTDEPSEEG